MLKTDLVGGAGAGDFKHFEISSCKGLIENRKE